jgi:hypothetical protein
MQEMPAPGGGPETAGAGTQEEGKSTVTPLSACLRAKSNHLFLYVIDILFIGIVWLMFTSVDAI